MSLTHDSTDVVDKWARGSSDRAFEKGMVRQLAERSKRYGSLRFDRLVIGLLTIEANLAYLAYDMREERVLEILKARRGLPTLKRVLSEIAMNALTQEPDLFVPSSDLGMMAVDAVVDAAAAWRPTRRGVLGRYQPWFGDQDEKRGLDPVDVLLWTALLLLDGADTALGRDFLRRLVQSLDADAALRSGLETPLTVVVTSRGGVFEGLTRVQTADVRWVAWAADSSLTSYQTFWRLFTTKLGLPETDLNSGYAILHRDAVAVVVWAVRRDVAGKIALNQNRGDAPPIAEISTPEDVRNHLFGLPEQPFPGTAGSVYFRENPPNGLWPTGKPVPIILVGAHASTLQRVTTYMTVQDAQ